MTGLAVEFFVKFARFEFALKHFDEFRTGNGNRVDPNWDRFAGSQKVSALFAPLLNSKNAAYLIAEPPMKRIIRNGRLDWKQTAPPTDMVGLVLAMRRVRNNLFHGDKTNPRLSRNQKLFRASIEIMNSMLAANDDVRIAFESNLEMA